MKYLTLCSMFIINSAYAIEHWECMPDWRFHGLSSNNGEAAVIATVSEDRTFGEIKVAGTYYYSKFIIDGFNRQWWFDGETNNNFYDFLFMINPNGNGTYYEFKGKSNSTKPSMYFICKQPVPPK